jgi:hypothetical protein
MQVLLKKFTSNNKFGRFGVVTVDRQLPRIAVLVAGMVGLVIGSATTYLRPQTSERILIAHQCREGPQL